MIGFLDDKKKVAAVISAMHEGMDEDHDRSALLLEPIQMLMDAAKNEDMEGVAQMVCKIHNILHGRYEEME